MSGALKSQALVKIGSPCGGELADQFTQAAEKLGGSLPPLRHFLCPREAGAVPKGGRGRG